MKYKYKSVYMKLHSYFVFIIKHSILRRQEDFHTIDLYTRKKGTYIL